MTTAAISGAAPAIFRDGDVIDRPAPDAGMQPGESAFIWIEALDPVDSDFAVPSA